MKFIVKILWGMLGFCVSIAFKNSATHAASWVAGPGFTVTAGDAVLRANCSISYGACTSASNNCSQFLGTIKNTMNSITATADVAIVLLTRPLAWAPPHRGIG